MQDNDLPVTLLDLLSNTLVLDLAVARLPLSSIFALSRTSRRFRSLVLDTPHVFRCLDLSRCRGAYVPPSLTPLDSGGTSWRSQRIDENLTEDEFYAGPLRGVFSKLSRMSILKDVHVLNLDGLASVTVDLVSEIITGQSYDVRILSVLGCVNLNQRKLQQLLGYVCRPSRPEGTPRLKGLYVFGTKDACRKEPGMSSARSNGGVTSSEGAQLGSLPFSTQSFSDYSDPWYSASGLVMPHSQEQRSLWEETLQVCAGIIALDAVLCTHMHAEMAPYLTQNSIEYLMTTKPAVPPLARVALGPAGCAGCGKAPRGAPVWGKSDMMEFPMLRPPPLTGRIVDAVRPPMNFARGEKSPQEQRLIVSCLVCLTERYCENCHRWWCGQCYDPEQSTRPRLLDGSISSVEPMPQNLGAAGNEGNDQPKGGIKVFYNLCVEACLVGEMMAGAGSNGMWA